MLDILIKCYSTSIVFHFFIFYLFIALQVINYYLFMNSFFTLSNNAKLLNNNFFFLLFTAQLVNSCLILYYSVIKGFNSFYLDGIGGGLLTSGSTTFLTYSFKNVSVSFETFFEPNYLGANEFVPVNSNLEKKSQHFFMENGDNTASGAASSNERTASSPNLNNNNNKEEEPRLLGTWTGYNIVQKNIPTMELINSKFQPPTIKPTMEVTPTGEVIYHYPNVGPAPAPTFEEIMIWRGYRSW